MWGLWGEYADLLPKLEVMAHLCTSKYKKPLSPAAAAVAADFEAKERLRGLVVLV